MIIMSHTSPDFIEIIIRVLGSLALFEMLFGFICNYYAENYYLN